MLCSSVISRLLWRCEKSEGRECGCVPWAAPKRRQIWLEIVVGGFSHVGSWLAVYLQCPASAQMAGLWCAHEKHAQGAIQLLCRASPAGSILVVRSGGHVLEGAPGGVVDAAHHGLDLLARAQLVQLVLACAAGDSWRAVVGQRMILWNNHRCRNGIAPQPPAERAVVSPAPSSARMVPSHCTGSTSWRGSRAAISAASLKGWAVTLE